MKFRIRDPKSTLIGGGFVYGISHSSHIVVMSPAQFARTWKTRRGAENFIESYAGAGYGIPHNHELVIEEVSE